MIKNKILILTSTLMLFAFICCEIEQEKTIEKKPVVYSIRTIQSTFEANNIDKLLRPDSRTISEKELKTRTSWNKAQITDTLNIGKNKIFVVQWRNNKEQFIGYKKEGDSLEFMIIGFLGIDHTELYFLKDRAYRKIAKDLVADERFILNVINEEMPESE